MCIHQIHALPALLIVIRNCVDSPRPGLGIVTVTEHYTARALARRRGLRLAAGRALPLVHVLVGAGSRGGTETSASAFALVSSPNAAHQRSHRGFLRDNGNRSHLSRRRATLCRAHDSTTTIAIATSVTATFPEALHILETAG